MSQAASLPRSGSWPTRAMTLGLAGFGERRCHLARRMAGSQRRQCLNRRIVETGRQNFRGVHCTHERAGQDELDAGTERSKPGDASPHALAAATRQRALRIVRKLRTSFFSNRVANQIQGRHQAERFLRRRRSHPRAAGAGPLAPASGAALLPCTCPAFGFQVAAHLAQSSDGGPRHAFARRGRFVDVMLHHLGVVQLPQNLLQRASTGAGPLRSPYRRTR